MKTLSLIIFSALTVLLVACGSSGNNIVPITAGQCGTGSYLNEPCVSVTVCTPNSNTCQTINNVLLDTGSYGLRVFASQLSIRLGASNDASDRPLAECVQYLGSNSDWGPVKLADVVLGGDKASSIPIQVIDASFGSIPSSCTNPDEAPQTAGFNGILGVGLLVQDCGASCASNANNGIYYACASGVCGGTVVPLQNQVANPIAALNSDNNGFAIQFAAISPNGAAMASGSLILGIGTQSNNKPAQVAVMQADGDGNFTTQAGGQNFPSSFIDSGTNLYIFPELFSLPTCNSSGSAAGLYCPQNTAGYNAITEGAAGAGASQQQVVFGVTNGQAALQTGLTVFNDVAGEGQNSFIWGFPFFLGKTIYFGLESQSTSLGQGPFWAY